VGVSRAFVDVLDLLQRFAASRAPILISGETGTGKEQAAQAAHQLSGRREHAFVPVNCGALPDGLLESELFGHSAGAFTGASQARHGLVREADGGTLFLDEIEALSGRGQGVLLRFLQDCAFRPLGEGRLRHADVRVIAASNVDLGRLVATHAFRADLLFRLDVLPITLPPLRDRQEDIEPLVSHLLLKVARSEGQAAKRISRAALDALRAHSWPGNVRELEHVILRAHLLSPGECIDLDDLLKCSPSLMPARPATAPDPNWLREQKLLAISEVERRYVERALDLGNGNISEAARLCKMERATLSKMAKKYRR
jgi:two-component system, NtrC family, response regulator GlrR